MRRTLVCFLVCIAWTLNAAAHTTAEPKARAKDLSGPAQIQGPSRVLSFEQYGEGVLEYRGEEMEWYAVVERSEGTVGAVVVTAGHRPFEQDVNEEIPIQHALTSNGDQVMTYFVFHLPVCDAASFDDHSCDYSAFVKDAITRLQRFTEVSCVCITEKESVPVNGVLPCAP